jgi:hypothetical protein
MPRIVFPTHSGHCKGITRQGAKCRHTVVYANDRCKQHGGVSPPMEVPTFEEAKEKTVTRMLKANGKAQTRSQRTLERWRSMLPKEQG